MAMRTARLVGFCATALSVNAGGDALAQRANENVVREASDAFGATIGNESIGIYSPGSVRGFNPVASGNVRLEGLFIEHFHIRNPLLFDRSAVRVGLSAQGYPFPAPSGIIDYSLQPAGRERVLSVVTSADSFAGALLEADLQMPISRTLSAAGGYQRRREVDYPGGDYLNAEGVGLSSDWRPSERATVRLFWGYGRFWRDRATGSVFASSARGLPDAPRRSVTQRWAEWNGDVMNLGGLGRINFGGWTLQAGLFAFDGRHRDNFSDLFVDAGADGIARHQFASDPPFGSRSVSGELRLTRRVEEGERRHLIHLSLMGRSRNRTYGGGDRRDFGQAAVFDGAQLPRPVFTYSTPTSEDVRQYVFGIGYHGIWPGRGEFSIGIQKVDYRRETAAPAGPVIGVRDRPWLWNSTLAVSLSGSLAVYGGVTRGLEEIDPAPDIASNKNEAPPAVVTQQRDFGIRLRLAPNLSLVAGGFDIRKPYYNLDRSNLYTRLGQIRHRGLEMSLSGAATRRLNVVVGLVVMRPRVSGEAVTQGIVGPRPLGQTGSIASLDADYALSDHWSLDASLDYTGSRPATRDNVLTIPGRAILAIGGRIRMRVGTVPATLRFRVENLLDYRGWNIALSGGMRPVAGRRASLQLRADL